MSNFVLSDKGETLIKVLMSVGMAFCSTVAVFVDTETTGTLSVALNGGGILPTVFFVIILKVFLNYYNKKNAMRLQVSKRENVCTGILASLFSICMIIGRAQTVHEELKYELLAVLLFIGYSGLFAGVLYLVNSYVDKYMIKCEIKKFGITGWVFEKHPGLAVALFILISRIPYFISFFPYVMTWDGGVQIGNYYGYENFTNHHPPFISFLYGPVALYTQKWGIPNAMCMIPILQIVLTIVAVSRLILFMKEQRVSYWFRWISLLYFSFFTVWPIFDMTFIKDSIYWQFTLLYTIQVTKCIVDEEAFAGKKNNFILLIVYAVLVSQVRLNGIFIVVGTLPILIMVVSKCRKALLISMCAVFGITYLMNQCVYPSLGVTNLKSKVDTYCIMYQQTAKYSMEFSEDVTQEEYAVLNKMIDYEALKTAYNPRLADWVKNCIRCQEGSPDDPDGSVFASQKADYIKVWFAQFLRHPWVYIDAFMECSYGYYYPDIGTYKEGLGFYESDRTTFPEEIHDSRQSEMFEVPRWIMARIPKLEYVPGVGILYRSGAYTWVVLYIAMYCFMKKKYKSLIITIPALINIAVCMISPVNTCIRYVLPTMCAVPLLFILLWAKNKELTSVNSD